MFFILPVGVDYRSHRYPMVTFTFIGICVGLYLIQWLLLLLRLFGGGPIEEYTDPLIMNFGLIPSERTWYTWVTSIFVHAGLFHIVGNMIYLFLFGACVEDTVGRGWFVPFFLVGGVFSAVAHVVMSGSASSDLPLVGASGAISACMGGFVLFFAKTSIEFRYFFWFFVFVRAGEFSLPSWIVISFWFLKDLVFALMEMQSSDGGGGVAFGAHVGGFVVGFLMILVYRAMTKQTSQHGPQKAQVQIRGVRSIHPANTEQSDLMMLDTFSEKICVLCGQDCSDQPRLKDTDDNYYHEDCYQHYDARQ